MSITRILPIGGQRFGNACLTLQFDGFLPEFERTVIISPLNGERVENIFKKYHINTENFQFFSDSEIIEKYPDINYWNLEYDYRSGWLQQQALKLSCLDMLNSTKFLIQDADSFSVENYEPFDDNKLNFFYLPNTSHASGYYEAFRNATGYERQTSHCFVCDMMPVLKSSWIDLTNLLGDRWLVKLIDSTPWDYVANVKWFSEYEFLANWQIATRQYFNLTEQRRFEVKNAEQIMHRDFPPNFNFISDKTRDTLPLDFAADDVLNFEHIIRRLLHLLPDNNWYKINYT
jgi:hypothetical protein